MTKSEIQGGGVELAERCEQAPGPDRDLDAEIMDALRIGEYRTKNGLLGYPLEPKPYTASLDAAMTLVPKGWHIIDLTDWTHDEAFDFWSVQLRRVAFKHHAVDVEAKTAALALCAAALRARAQHGGSHDT